MIILKQTLLIYLLILASCDRPHSTPVLPGQDYQGPNFFQQSQNGGEEATNPPADEANNNPTPLDENDLTQGYTTCNSTKKFYINNIGYFSLCGHDDDERKFRVSFAQQDLSIGNCFVPIHITQEGKSFKLGIAECVKNQAERAYFMTLFKDRPDPINGVMVVKYTSVNSYMQCMNAKVNYIQAHPGCATNPSCLQSADQYAHQVCSMFAQNHQGSYQQIKCNKGNCYIP